MRKQDSEAETENIKVNLIWGIFSTLHWMCACSRAHQLLSYHGEVSESAVLASWSEHFAMMNVPLVFKETVLHCGP